MNSALKYLGVVLLELAAYLRNGPRGSGYLRVYLYQ